MNLEALHYMTEEIQSNSLIQEKIINKFYIELTKRRQLLLEKDTEESINSAHNTKNKNKIIISFYRTFLLRFISIKVLLDWKLLESDPIQTILDSNPINYQESFNNLFFQTLKKLLLDSSINHNPFLASFLNSSIFDKTSIELDHPNLELSVTDFEDLWNFLKSYKFIHKNNIHIDEQTITFEILSYIFEKTISLVEENRVETGSYYTPSIISKFMANQTLEHYLIYELSKKVELQEIGLLNSLDFSKFNPTIKRTLHIELLKILMNLKILDPTCGSGVYVIAIASEILSKYESIITDVGWESFTTILHEEKIIKSPLTNFYDLKRFIISNNIIGVDIQESAIEICKLLTWFWILEPFENKIFTNDSHTGFIENYDLENNFKLGNSLGGKPKINIPSLISKNKFDIVIGNPPYLGESGNKELFNQLRILLPDYYEAKMDIWYFFLFKAFDYVKKDGFVSFITSNYWKTATGASKLRKDIYYNRSIKLFIDFMDNKIFSNANGIHSNILIIQNTKQLNNTIECIIYADTFNSVDDIILNKQSQRSFSIHQKDLMNSVWNDYFYFSDNETKLILNKITNESIKLSQNFYSIQGVVTGLNKVTKKKIEKFDIKNALDNDGVFILDPSQENDRMFLNKLTTEELMCTYPLYKNSNIEQYKISPTNLKILYLNNNSSIDNKPNVNRHLFKFKAILDTRREVKTKKIKFFQLQWPRDIDILKKPKIVHVYRGLTNNFTYVPGLFISTQDTYYIVSKIRNHKQEKNLLGILNSTLAYFYFYNFGKKKGNAIELFGEPIEDFPLPTIFEKFHISPLIDYILYLQSLSTNPVATHFLTHLVDELVFELYFKNGNEQYNTNQHLYELVTKEFVEIDIDNWLKGNSGLINTDFERIINYFYEEISTSKEYLELSKDIKNLKEVKYILSRIK